MQNGPVRRCMPSTAAEVSGSWGYWTVLILWIVFHSLYFWGLQVNDGKGRKDTHSPSWGEAGRCKKISVWCIAVLNDWMWCSGSLCKKEVIKTNQDLCETERGTMVSVRRAGSGRKKAPVYVSFISLMDKLLWSALLRTLKSWCIDQPANPT